MQFKTLLLPSLLLLAPVSAGDSAAATYPEGPLVKMSGLGLSKRTTFAEPLYAAMPVHAGGPLVRRQSCSVPCSSGCCNTGWYCDDFNGTPGCCPNGKLCNSISGCTNPIDVYCGTYCCPNGSTCAVDSLGDNTCETAGSQPPPDEEEDPGNNGGGSEQCSAGPGWEKCPDLDGCCPSGVACIPPNRCDLACGPADPLCGLTGCCPQGTVCGANLKCTKEAGGFPSPTATATGRVNTSFTFLRPTETETEETEPETETEETEPETTTEADETTSTEETTTAAETTSETDVGANTDSSTTGTETSPTTSSSSSTTTPDVTIPRLTISVTVTGTGNAAPTLAAMMGGIAAAAAAGLVGVLAM